MWIWCSPSCWCWAGRGRCTCPDHPRPSRGPRAGARAAAGPRCSSSWLQWLACIRATCHVSHLLSTANTRWVAPPAPGYWAAAWAGAGPLAKAPRSRPWSPAPHTGSGQLYRHTWRCRYFSTHLSFKSLSELSVYCNAPEWRTGSGRSWSRGTWRPGSRQTTTRWLSSRNFSSFWKVT